MKVLKIAVIALLAGTILVGETACNSMNQTGKGALIGGGGGAALGAGLGAIIGGGKGAGIGSAIGAAVGAGAGALIGRRMDKQQQELQAQLANQAKVEQTTDQNGLQAIKVQVYGFTDNTGSLEVNQRVSTGRADAVLRYLVNSGVSPTRVTAQGIPMADYVASNETAAGRAQNRRVEIYITASPEMVQQAEAGTLK